jgi:HIV Tat-specific factor 1
MFTVDELEKDPALLFELKEDIRSECEKLGEVTNIQVYDRSDEGVCSVKFKDLSAAQACVRLMNGRFFGGRRVDAKHCESFLELKTFKVKESFEDGIQRMEKYGEWLEANEESEKEGENEESENEKEFNEYENDEYDFSNPLIED